MSQEIRFIRTHEIAGTLDVLSGLRIGAGRDTIEIGGIDAPVIKDPHTQRPYIPGSSLKGKLRSLLEWTLDCIENDGNVWGSSPDRQYDSQDAVLRIFGTTHKNWQAGPARILVRDAHLNAEWDRKITSLGLPLTEEKSEVVINRIQGKAAQMGPRRMERVPAGAQFDFEILFKVYSVNGDGGARDRHCLARLVEALKLVEFDALGGSGSRGYGRIRFSKLTIDGQNIQTVFDSLTAISKTAPNQSLTSFLESRA